MLVYRLGFVIVLVRCLRQVPLDGGPHGIDVQWQYERTQRSRLLCCFRTRRMPQNAHFGGGANSGHESSKTGHPSQHAQQLSHVFFATLADVTEIEDGS